MGGPYAVESFAGGDGGPPLEPDSYLQPRRFVRFDKTALYAAVNEEREHRGMTWEQVAAEIWPSGPWGPQQLKGMAGGGRADVYQAVAVCE